MLRTPSRIAHRMNLLTQTFYSGTYTTRNVVML